MTTVTHEQMIEFIVSFADASIADDYYRWLKQALEQMDDKFIHARYESEVEYRLKL